MMLHGSEPGIAKGARPTMKPTMKTQMFIRRPVAEVFEAIVNPDVTTRFWFTRSTGRLEAGKHVTWQWEMYGASTGVNVEAVEPLRRVAMTWGPEGAQTSVEWTFQAVGEAGTYLTIMESGYPGTPDEVLARMSDSQGGFSFVLAGLKAWLEHGIQLDLVGDKYPPEVRSLA
jgi:uncharacterized protein YndB with AHSA1/START domain